jgi:hypothetical protein
MSEWADRWYTDKDFVITDDHKKLAGQLNVCWQGDYEWGTVEFGDAKRPFGNGDMPRDVAEILGWTIVRDEYGEDVLTAEQVETATRLYREMGYVAKSLLEVFAGSHDG